MSASSRGASVKTPIRTPCGLKPPKRAPGRRAGGSGAAPGRRRSAASSGRQSPSRSSSTRRRRDAVVRHVELDVRPPRGVLEPVAPERPRVCEHGVEIERESVHAADARLALQTGER